MLLFISRFFFIYNKFNFKIYWSCENRKKTSCETLITNTSCETGKYQECRPEYFIHWPPPSFLKALHCLNHCTSPVFYMFTTHHAYLSPHHNYQQEVGKHRLYSWSMQSILYTLFIFVCLFNSWLERPCSLFAYWPSQTSTAAHPPQEAPADCCPCLWEWRSHWTECALLSTVETLWTPRGTFPRDFSLP